MNTALDHLAQKLHCRCAYLGRVSTCLSIRERPVSALFDVLGREGNRRLRPKAPRSAAGNPRPEHEHRVIAGTLAKQASSSNEIAARWLLPEAIDTFPGALRATHPDFVYTPYGAGQVLHDAGRLAWGSGLAGEAPTYTGWDVIIVRGGKIAALYVFLDETSDEYRHAVSAPKA